MAGAWPRYGSERITAQMKREGITFHSKPVGERRTRRVMREMGLLSKPRPRKIRTTDSNHAFPRFENLVKGLSVTRPNQVWVSDITYIRLGSSFVYLTVIMDVFTRSIRGWFLSRRLDGDLTLITLTRALETATLETATPEIHHSDQGGRYTLACTSMRQRHMLLCSKAKGVLFQWRRWVALKKTALPSD